MNELMIYLSEIFTITANSINQRDHNQSLYLYIVKLCVLFVNKQSNAFYNFKLIGMKRLKYIYTIGC